MPRWHVPVKVPPFAIADVSNSGVKLHSGVSTSVSSFALDPDAVASALSEEAGAKESFAGMRILLVEDDPDMRGYVAKELSRQYNVLTAANGEDALELIEKQRIDLVVSDIMMPGVDGCALCNRIKSTTEYSHIPVILLTAAVGMSKRKQKLTIISLQAKE